MPSMHSNGPKIQISKPGSGGTGSSPLSISEDGVVVSTNVIDINFTGTHVNVTSITGSTNVDIDFSANIDGGFANSVYLTSQVIDGGNAFS